METSCVWDESTELIPAADSDGAMGGEEQVDGPNTTTPSPVPLPHGSNTHILKGENEIIAMRGVRLWAGASPT